MAPTAKRRRSPRVITVLLGDVVASRQVVDRRGLVDQVAKGLRSARARYAPHMLAPPARTAGDSVVFALSVSDDAYDIALLLDRVSWPHRFRWALASGTVDVGQRSRNVTEMDGPAFHRAAGALQRARHEDLPFALDLADRSAPVQRLVEWLMRLCAEIRSDWTAAEARVAHLMHDAERQLDVASQIGITPQAVAQALRRAKYQDLEVAANLIRDWLAHPSDAEASIEASRA